MDRDVYFRTRGDISVRLYEGRVGFDSMKILLVGPTGSGKSSFIEALSGESCSNLGISNDQLAGYTQKVTAYELVNAKYYYHQRDAKEKPVYLIDTPGFLDSKISEMEIVVMVKKWLKDNWACTVDRILYVCPITIIRLSGSKARNKEMFERLISVEEKATIVTSMWDSLCTQRLRERAIANYAQLRDETWKDLLAEGGQITKFWNTHASAVDIIREAIGDSLLFSMGDTLRMHRLTRHDRCATYLYRDLLERIDSAQKQQRALRAELAQPDTQENTELESIVKAQLQEAEDDLVRFVGQFVAFGAPPPQLEGVMLPWRILTMKGCMQQGWRAASRIMGNTYAIMEECYYAPGPESLILRNFLHPHYME